MSTTSKPNGTEEVHPDDELLVAYLDSELSREDRTNLEDRLVEDETLRNRLQSLQRTWDILGCLPDPTHNETSVRTTLELVVDDLTRHGRRNSHLATPKETSAGPRLFRSGKWLAFGFMIAMAVTSYVVSRSITKNRIQRQIADLPIIVDLDAYQAAADLDLLRDLDADPYWRGLPSTQPPTPNAIRDASLASQQSLFLGTEKQTKLASPDESTLRSAIANWSNEEKLIIYSKMERFDRLDELGKQRLRETAHELALQDDGARLLDVARNYARLRDQIDSDLLAKIEGDSREDRLNAIADAADQILASIGQATSEDLSDEAVERISFTLREVARLRIERGDKALRGFSNMLRSRLRDAADEQVVQSIMVSAILRSSRGGRSPWEDLKLPPNPSTRGSFDSRSPDNPFSMRDRIDSLLSGSKKLQGIRPLDEDELGMIEAMLPVTDYDALQSLTADPWMRSFVLRDWVDAAWVRYMFGNQPPKTLAERYIEMPSRQRDVIDLMPPGNAQSALLQKD